jgi:hypothetical protein
MKEKSESKEGEKRKKIQASRLTKKQNEKGTER